MTEPAPAVPDAVLAFLASVGTGSPAAMEKALPVSAAMIRRKESRQKKAEEAVLNGNSDASEWIGQSIGKEGIFLGRYAPVDRHGNSLGKIFNVFAAPEDLTDAAGKKAVFYYDQAVRLISQLEGWHGHDGTSYKDDTEIFAALKDGSYKGGWIIPPAPLLDGRDADGKKVQRDNLYAHRNKEPLKESFAKPAWTQHATGFFDWYWSSTTFPNRDLARHLQFDKGDTGGWCLKDNSQSCRPVRLVAVGKSEKQP